MVRNALQYTSVLDRASTPLLSLFCVRFRVALTGEYADLGGNGWLALGCLMYPVQGDRLDLGNFTELLFHGDNGLPNMVPPVVSGQFRPADCTDNGCHSKEPFSDEGKLLANDQSHSD